MPGGKGPDLSAWSEPGGGLVQLLVATMGLPSTWYLKARDSFRAALNRMRADPEWNKIASREDADRLIDKYL